MCEENNGIPFTDAEVLNSLTQQDPDNDIIKQIDHSYPAGFRSQIAFYQKDADIIDVYEALDMFLPGLFAYRSVLKGGVCMQIPNLRDPAEREKWRNDTACTDPCIAGDALLPTCSSGTPVIDRAVYEKMYRLWRQDFESDNGYTYAAMTQGSKKE